MGKNQWAIAFGLLLIVAASLLTYLFVLRAPGDISLPLVENCMLQIEPCSSKFPTGGKMTFAISPKRPEPTDALNFSVGFEDIEPQAVQVRFKGENMDMGYMEYLRYSLARIDSDGNTISFAGKGGVFACSTGLMSWLVLVDVEIDGTVYEVPFKFETGNDG